MYLLKILLIGLTINYLPRRKVVILITFLLITSKRTVIGKNDTRSSVTLLTTTGVVNVKFTKEYFAMYNRQISEKQSDGTKKVVEKGWFTRGVKLLVAGYRRDDTFVAKTYKNNGFNQLYRITKVEKDGSIELEHNRKGMESDE